MYEVIRHFLILVIKFLVLIIITFVGIGSFSSGFNCVLFCDEIRMYTKAVICLLEFVLDCC